MATAQDLLDAGAAPRTATQRIRQHVLDRLAQARRDGKDRTDALASLFPNVVLEPEALESLAASLLSGSHVLFLGPPGSGKTSLAKAVWDLVPKDVVAVDGCPVQDDPWSMLDPAYARAVPPCPVCIERHDPERTGKVRPADIPVRKARLREGHGFARVQGSPEVFPDNLTGSVDLARLEEVGDPNSPLVLAPGKILQAHRGLLLVDEVGKLPRGTQNVLLQALQERIVTPAKSRETFPADILAVTTSNVHDLGNITEPLTDRLANVLVDFPRTVDGNRRIVDLGIGADVDVPGPYRDVAVRLVMAWRATAPPGDDLGEVGSNRALVDICRRAWSHAALSDGSLDPEDLKRGALDAMSGRIRARSADGFDENRQRVRSFIEERWPKVSQEGAHAYWCRYFEGELKGDKSAGARAAKAVREAVSGGRDMQAAARDGGDPEVKRFARFVEKQEQVAREEAPGRVPVVWRALEDLGAFKT